MASRSSSPRKKDSTALRGSEGTRSRSRSKSPRKSTVSLETNRKSSGSSARIVEVHETSKAELRNNEDEDEDEFDDETNGSSVSLDV